MLLIDIGGGSTELVVAEGDIPTMRVSTPLGVVALTERYLTDAFPTDKAWEGLRYEIKGVLWDTVPKLPKNPLFVGTAGTLTTLAAMDQKMAIYDPSRINGYRLSKEAIEAIFNKFKSMTSEERLLVPGLERGREDVIMAGIVILLTLMGLCHYDEVYISDEGLREGVLIDRYLKGVEGE